MSAISVKNLDVVFGQHTKQTLALLDQGQTREQVIDATGDVVAVHDVSLDIQAGEICVLMGLSGSGKSSLLRAINGLNPVSRGHLVVEDENENIDLASCSANQLRHLRTSRVAMVFQKFALMPWLSVLDNAAFGLELQGIDKNERRQRAFEKLEMVGLDQWQHKFPHELSGGMQQRVGLARAFTMDSDILLMDEPFSALDPLIRTQLQDELLLLQRKLNKTIVFVSHDLDEALKLGNNIAIMESGKIVQHGKPEDIVLRPNCQYVKDFVAHTNPLNVLSGEALMTPSDQLSRKGNLLVINELEQVYVETSGQGELENVVQSGESYKIRLWQGGDSLSDVNAGEYVLAPPQISMRDALEIRYKTGNSLLLGTPKLLEGVLHDDDFYHALLGKHISLEPA